MLCIVFLFLAINILTANAWTNIIQQKQQLTIRKHLMTTTTTHLSRKISSTHSSHTTYTSLQMAEVFELEDEAEVKGEDIQTDQQLGKTHGYEGDFKINDIVKVNSDIRIWHVKAYSKDGFLATGFHGRVIGFDLYGRKFSSLCSAITPIRVEFEPNGEGIPSGMFYACI